VHLVVSATGKALPQAPGLSGGYPAGTQYDVLTRGTSTRYSFAGGRIPATLDELGGDRQVMPNHAETDMGPDDVYYTHWQGGGGYGDPLLRAPDLVAADVRAGRVSAGAASGVYGVVLAGHGTVDEDATSQHRTQLRRERAGVA
jgi:N-methylhydantoinase B